jgi:bacterioferritin
MYNKSIELLNKAVADELVAVHQYLYFHFHCADQGLATLADLFKKTALMEMKHVEKISERVLFLKGDIDMKGAEEVKKIRLAREMLELAALMEKSSVNSYNQWANECSATLDAGSKQLFEELVSEEEQHFARFDLELENIRKYGDHYLAMQSIEHHKEA